MAVFVPGDGRPFLGNSRSAPGEPSSQSRPLFTPAAVKQTRLVPACDRSNARRLRSVGLPARRNRPLVAHLRRTAEISFVWQSLERAGKRPIPSVRLFAASEEGNPLAKVVPAGLPKQIFQGPRTMDEAGRQCKTEKGGKGEAWQEDENRHVLSLLLLTSHTVVVFPFFHSSPFPFLTLVSTFGGHEIPCLPGTYVNESRLCTDLPQCVTEKLIVSSCGDAVYAHCPEKARPGVRPQKRKKTSTRRFLSPEP